MKAKFSRLSNDLYWSAFIDGATIRWVGYDDGYWWAKVAPTDQFQVKEHKGKRYRLNLDWTITEEPPLDAGRKET